MLRFLIGIVVVLAVGGAAYAAAADLVVDGGSIQAGTDGGTLQCDTVGVSVDYDVAWSATANYFDVTDVYVTDIDAACDGFDVAVELLDINGASLLTASLTGTVTAGAFSSAVADDVDANAVEDVAVAVNSSAAP